jgi:RNA polymerase sigma factor (TIGR02999 family)
MSEARDVLNRSAPDGRQDQASFPPSAYQELRKLAAQKLANERSGQTLQATALVHEVYLRLMSGARGGPGQEPAWKTHGHFFAAAAETMRRILVENARRKNRIKHGGGRSRVELSDHHTTAQPLSDDIVALDEALLRLAKEDPAAAQVVELHFFAGLSIEQAADALGMSRATAYRQWAYARAWLACAISGDQA